jgi:predicted ribonuclease YlaK
MSESTVYAFLDTNTVLHFKRPDLIDWNELIDATTIFVVVTPVLVRELEQQKIHNRSRKLRERAQSILSWLANFVDEENASEIRSGIHLLFLRYSPSINFDENKLSRLISDDELIASTLEFKSQHGADVVVSTADLGLRMKLPAHGLKGVAPNESDRLPNEPDESEKELINARRELF